MNIIKKAVESHQRAQTISILAIGISVFALIAVLAIAGGRNAAR